MMLAEKEEELTRLMKEYYQYDMPALGADLNGLLENEVQKLNESHQHKMASLDNQFSQISKVSTKHLELGSQYQNLDRDKNEPQENAKQKMMGVFDKQSEEYQEVISKANEQK